MAVEDREQSPLPNLSPSLPSLKRSMLSHFPVLDLKEEALLYRLSSELEMNLLEFGRR
jgi:hypothetical protein